MNDVVLISRAADFAAQRHADQRRKGASKEPYINHLSEVARRLAMATEGSDGPLVAAGWLHDTIEDTATSRDDLTLEFGDDVASLVIEVTDDKKLPKAERKRLQVVQTPKKSRRARMIKIDQQPAFSSERLGTRADRRLFRLGRQGHGRMPRHQFRA